MSSRPCRRPANCHRHLGTFVRFHRHSKAIIHEYLRAQAYAFNLVQRSCHICLHDLLCARVVAYIRKCIFRYICGYRSALLQLLFVHKVTSLVGTAHYNTNVSEETSMFHDWSTGNDRARRFGCRYGYI